MPSPRVAAFVAFSTACSCDLAIHATLTAGDFFLAYFYPSGLFTCIFSKTSPELFLLAVANTGSSVSLQNEIGYPAGCRFPF